MTDDLEPVDYASLSNADLSHHAGEWKRSGLPLPLDLLTEMDQRGWLIDNYKHQ